MICSLDEAEQALYELRVITEIQYRGQVGLDLTTNTSRTAGFSKKRQEYKTTDLLQELMTVAESKLPQALSC